MKKSLIIGLSALALATGGAAYAKHHGHGMSADADGNGLVTRAEAEAGAAAKFAKIDANNDGAITPADHEARMTEMRTRMFAAIDADKSGQISRDEFMNHKHEGGHGGMHGGKGMGHKMGMRGHGHGKMMMQNADANSDGSITKAEFTAAALARFQQSDTNGDGQVSTEERKAHHEQMRAKWQEMKHGEHAS